MEENCNWLYAYLMQLRKEGKVIKDLTEPAIFPVFRRKEDQNDCYDYRGMSLWSIPGN